MEVFSKVKHIPTIIIILGFFCPLYGQNIAPNGSFESGTDNYPYGPSQIPNLDEWDNFESSDWYSSTPGLYQGYFDPSGLTNGIGGPGVMTAHSGDKFIGFGPCEGTQVKLTSKTGINHVVKVSFWWSPRTKRNTEINMYLLKEKANTNVALADCNNPNIDYEFTSKVNVYSEGTNPVHVPGQWYYYESPAIRMTEAEYEFFVIKGRNVSGNITSHEYIYVDDISVSSVHECNHICSPTGNVSFMQIQGQPNTLANAMIGNVLNWFMTVQNATEIDFVVFSGASQEWFHYNAYDPSGLVDPGYNDYAFQWNGEDDNGQPVQFGIYNFNLTIKNCDHQLKYLAQPLLIFPAQGPITQYPPYQSNIMKDCCIPNATFNNITFPNNFREDVDDYIIAGNGGPTIVSQNTQVKFFAGNNIILGPGFQTFGDFVGEIAPCGTFSQRGTRGELIAQNDLDSIIQRAESEFGTKLFSNNTFEIHPNPSNGKFNVLHNYIVESNNIEVLDIHGKIIWQRTNFEQASIIDLSNFPNGVYLIKFIANNQLTVRKVFKQ